MKIFGGFGGKHHHGREPEKAIPEPEELSPAAAAEPGEETLQADPIHEPDEIPADAVSEEAVSAETISDEMSVELKPELILMLILMQGLVLILMLMLVLMLLRVPMLLWQNQGKE